MPHKEQEKKMSKKVDALTLAGHSESVMNQQANRRNSVTADKTKDIAAMAEKMAQAHKTEVANHLSHVNGQFEALTATVNTLSGTAARTYERALRRMDENNESSERCFNIVTSLDSYLKLLTDTGADGSDTYMNALNSIIAYREKVIQMDGCNTDDLNSAELESAFNNMKEKVNAAIRSYNARGIKSTSRTGGKRRSIFMTLQVELIHNEADPETDGDLYRSFATEKAFLHKRESENTEEATAEYRETRAAFDQTINDLDALIAAAKKIEDPKVSKEKIKLLNERMAGIGNSYKSFINSEAAIKTPAVTRLQKKAYAERISKWKTLRSKCKTYKTYKNPGITIDRSNIKGTRYEILDDCVNYLSENLDRIADQGNANLTASARKMYSSLYKLQTLHRSVTLCLDKQNFGFAKGTSALLEQTFQEAYEDVKAISRKRSNTATANLVSSARMLKAEMETGELASGIGELIIISSLREQYLYESKADIEAPVTPEELQEINRPFSDKEYTTLATDVPSYSKYAGLTAAIEKNRERLKNDKKLKPASKRALQAKIDADEEKLDAVERQIEVERAKQLKDADPLKYIYSMGRLYEMQNEYNYIDKKYSIGIRETYEPGISENDDALPEVQRCILPVAQGILKDFSRSYKSVTAVITSLENTPLNMDMLSNVEIAVAAMKLERRLNRLFVLEYKRRSEGKNLDKKQKNSLIYDMLMNTELGNACRRVCLMTSSAGILRDQGVGDSIIRMHKVNNMANARAGIGNNLADDIYNLEHEILIKNQLATPDTFLPHAGDDAKMAESQRIEGFLKKFFRGKKYTDEQKAAFMGRTNLDGFDE